MTPQELKLLDELFDRLASLESAPRDPDAVRAINEGLKLAPNALYPLVQTALVQDEALKRADARIRELEAELGIGQPQQPQQGGFLDSMRDALTGRREQQDQRGSVPSVRPGTRAKSVAQHHRHAGRRLSRRSPAMRPQPAPQQAPGAGGGSFLGTAAATAAGVVGGALLMNSFRGMFGGERRQSGGQGRATARSTPRAATAAAPGAATPAAAISPAMPASTISAAAAARRPDDGGSDRAGLLDTAQNDRRSVRFRRRRHR